jgi:hypothetical protein
MSSLTLVTGLFDLTPYRNPPNTTERTVEDYLRKGEEFLLRVDLPLCVFACKKAAPRIMEIRKSLGFGEITRVYEMELRDLPIFQETALLDSYERLKQHYIEIGKWWTLRFIPEFLYLILSKFDFLHRICEENPFDTTHAAWVDFALNRREKIHDEERCVEIFHKIRDHLRPKLAFGVFTNREITEETLLNGWIAVCAGALITAPVAKKQEVAKIFALAKQKIREGRVPYDETILYFAAFHDPTIECDCYKTSGNYNRVLVDYIHGPSLSREPTN